MGVGIDQAQYDERPASLPPHGCGTTAHGKVSRKFVTNPLCCSVLIVLCYFFSISLFRSDSERRLVSLQEGITSQKHTMKNVGCVAIEKQARKVVVSVSEHSGRARYLLSVSVV